MPTNRDDVGIAIRSAFLKKGTKQKFSLIVLLAVSAIFLYLDTLQTKPLNLVRSAIKDFIYQSSIIATLPEKGLQNVTQIMQTHFNTYKENARLKKENATLRGSIHDNSFLKVENLELKKILKQGTRSSSLFKNSKVIIDKNSPFIKSIIINKGSREKIKKGMAVLDDDNFIGRIVEVNFLSSRVLLVTDLNSKIPVIIEPHGYQAILSGNGKEEPVLDYLPKNYEMESGNIVYTSGKDGIFFPGIPIGEIKFNNGAYSVSLFSDLTQLSYVNIELEKTVMDFN